MQTEWKDIGMGGDFGPGIRGSRWFFMAETSKGEMLQPWRSNYPQLRQKEFRACHSLPCLFRPDGAQPAPLSRPPGSGAAECARPCGMAVPDLRRRGHPPNQAGGLQIKASRGLDQGLGARLGRRTINSDGLKQKRFGRSEFLHFWEESFKRFFDTAVLS